MFYMYIHKISNTLFLFFVNMQEAPVLSVNTTSTKGQQSTFYLHFKTRNNDLICFMYVTNLIHFIQHVTSLMHFKCHAEMMWHFVQDDGPFWFGCCMMHLPIIMCTQWIRWVCSINECLVLHAIAPLRLNTQHDSRFTVVPVYVHPLLIIVNHVLWNMIEWLDLGSI